MNNHAYDSYDAGTEHHRFRNSLLTLLLGAVVYGCWRQVSRTHRLRMNEGSERLPKRLQTWEGEGGRPDPDPEPSVGPGTPGA